MAHVNSCIYTYAENTKYVFRLQLNEGLRVASINAPIPSMILQVWLLNIY